LPTLELGAIGDLETDVVEAGAGLSERFCLVSVVVVQDHPQISVGLDKNHSEATLVWIVRNSLESEDARVPSDALLNISDSQREVMDT
jgi:hypothetical protein